MYHQTTFGCKRINCSWDLVETIEIINDDMSPHCALDFETAKQFFHRTLRLMVMCHHTNLGYKMPKGSEDGPDKHPLTFLIFVDTPEN